MNPRGDNHGLTAITQRTVIKRLDTSMAEYDALPAPVRLRLGNMAAAVDPGEVLTAVQNYGAAHVLRGLEIVDAQIKASMRAELK